MRRPSTGAGRKRSKPRAAAKAARPQSGEIKVTRNSARPEIKASRGPGGAVRRRKVAEPRSRSGAGGKQLDPRVAETRRQSLNTMGSGAHARAASAKRQAPRQSSRTVSVRGQASGGGSFGVRAVAIGAGGGAAAARVVQEVARPVGAVAAPVLRVVTDGLEAIPQAASRSTPIARGRWLVAVAALMALGLISINVAELKAGDGYAAYSARSLELQRENMTLRTRIANLGAAERIKAYAEKQGLVMPAPEQFNYLRSRRGDAERAASRYQQPSSSARPLAPGATAATGATPATSVPPAADAGGAGL